MNDNIERMLEGRLYDPGDEEIFSEQLQYLDLISEYNKTRASQLKRREALLKLMLAEVGDNCYIEAPFFANWGGHHVHFGNNVYANFNLTLVDDGHIYVGDCVMFGPNVTVATAGHPILPSLRERAIQFNRDVHIGSNVWIGAGTIILPGVTIGNNTVIGAGSVVTKDIPADSVAYGNPCRVARPIGEKDKQYYFKDCPVDME